MERLKQTYSPEILAVMKMSNIEGLKQHYRCHKDKRAKTIKTMASVTGVVNTYIICNATFFICSMCQIFDWPGG